MVRAQSEIDRLIDEGLTRYGLGDLDGALAAWETALELDPQQDRAQSYIDYVRSNYELLASEVSGHSEAPPFAISDEDPGYQIEVTAGELGVAGTPAPQIRDSIDGWPIDEERPSSLEMRELTFELEIDDPDDAAGLGLESYPPRPQPKSVSFEEATNEYGSLPPRQEPAPARTEDSVSQEFQLDITPTPGFDAEFTPGFGTTGDLQTPAGFATQVTDVRPRDLGFVQVTQGPATQPMPPPKSSGPATQPMPPPKSSGPATQPMPPPPQPPDLKLSLRTQETSYEIESPTVERPPGSFGDPRRFDDRSRAKPGMTRDLPGATRKPASSSDPPGSHEPPTSQPQAPASRPPLGELPRRLETRDFDAPTERRSLPRPATPAGSLIPPSVREHGEPTTSKLVRPPTRPITPPPAAAEPKRPGTPPLVSLPLGQAPIVTAPTRDLGLRQQSESGLPPADDASRQALQRAPTLMSPAEPPRDNTRDDVVLPFDPIGARSEQILGAIDDEAPPDESKEDRTRRRITALFERAVAWNKAGELDRAVAAIDLALSEDPNSALAQKLIHRHRETMMTVFQAFLGDLDRTPVLARPLHELSSAPISPRAAFLLSRVDGQLSLDSILDVSGMPRLEAYRYLCQLFLRGILR